MQPGRTTPRYLNRCQRLRCYVFGLEYVYFFHVDKQHFIGDCYKRRLWSMVARTICNVVPDTHTCLLKRAHKLDKSNMDVASIPINCIIATYSFDVMEQGATIATAATAKMKLDRFMTLAEFCNCVHYEMLAAELVRPRT